MNSKYLLGASKALFLVMACFMALFACAEDKKVKEVKKEVKAEKAEAVEYVEGKHYSIVKNSKKPAPGSKVEVMEVFWYGCGHCFKFESVLKPWKDKKANYIDFKRTPAMWTVRRPGMPSNWMEIHAKLYYTAQSMQYLDKLHLAFFEAMHKQNKQMYSPKEIENVVSAQGFNGKNFVAVMDSFAVKSLVEQADRRQKQYSITGTPEIIVGGHYHVTAKKAGTQKAMLEIASHLAKKIYEGK